MEILIKRINDSAKLPTYSSEAASGIDLCALEETTIEPGARVMVVTGIAMAIPVGYVGVIWSENYMVINELVKVTTSMIDSGYRDEIKVELLNTGSETKTFAAGEPIAQILVKKVERASLIEVEDLSA